MKFNLLGIGVGLLLSMSATSSFATEYIYRDLRANTLPNQKCETKDQAEKTAEKQYKINIYTKKFCQTQGYGWHVETVKSTGKTVCNECSTSGTYQCYLEDVEVQCKRIKPGSVGMLPGKG